MSFPCVDPAHFDVPGGELTPRDHLQWRHVARNTAASVEKDYTVVLASAPVEDLLTFTVAWTNNTAIAQKVYGLLTRGGTLVELTARTRAYIETYLGSQVGTLPFADPAAATLIGQFGNGANIGTYSGGNVGYFITETRIGERTILAGDTVTLSPGQTYKLTARLRMGAANWEASPIQGGNTSETAAHFVTGGSQLDLFAYPSL